MRKEFALQTRLALESNTESKTIGVPIQSIYTTRPRLVRQRPLGERKNKGRRSLSTCQSLQAKKWQGRGSGLRCIVVWGIMKRLRFGHYPNTYEVKYSKKKKSFKAREDLREEYMLNRLVCRGKMSQTGPTELIEELQNTKK